MTRAGRIALLIGTPLIMLAVIGAIYLQIYTSSHASREAWMVTQDVAAGTRFTSSNVERVTIPDASPSFAVLTRDPIQNGLRAGHRIAASTLLTPSDIMGRTQVLVPVVFSASPNLSAGDHVDIYAVVDGAVTEVGRNLVVATPQSVWVPAPDEADWVALRGTNVTLVAVRSSGAGSPQTERTEVQQAIAALNRAAGGNAPVPSPTPSPGR
ncbi:MAG: hypothetical protein J2P44_06985 [Candidatus Dormibacteraeota bacterium]|nr:hypothetical protein [Candidatus Dormibacteraeota bacterium]